MLRHTHLHSRLILNVNNKMNEIPSIHVQIMSICLLLDFYTFKYFVYFRHHICIYVIHINILCIANNVLFDSCHHFQLYSIPLCTRRCRSKSRRVSIFAFFLAYTFEVSKTITITTFAFNALYPN